ncbi:MAG: hypothetical protein JXR76_10960 [Deltaproteobacteria bacterium]|nr:hypothetical protein [Deltaproteobacteria bacterium]
MGIAESYSHDSDTEQTDLGTKDNAQFGVELWPFATTGPRIIRADSPTLRVTENVTPLDLKNHFLHFDIAFGACIPAGKIAQRSKPGMALNAHWLARAKQQQFGVFFHISGSSTAADNVVPDADAPGDPTATPLLLPSESVRATFGVVWNPLVRFKGSNSLHPGVRIGGIYSYIQRGTRDGSDSSDGIEFKEYTSRRGGFATGQHLNMVHYFCQNRQGAIGLLRRLSPNEAISFGIRKYHKKFDGEDLPLYGIKSYPAVSLGIKASI